MTDYTKLFKSKPYKRDIWFSLLSAVNVFIIRSRLIKLNRKGEKDGRQEKSLFTSVVDTCTAILCIWL